MRKTSFIFILVIVCLTLNLFAIAEISFENKTFDFGKIKEESGPYEHLFEFTNSGDKPFKILKVEAG